MEEILNELEAEEDDSKDEEEKLDEMGKPIYKAEYVQSQHMYKADDIMEDEEFDLDALLKEISNLDKKAPVKENTRPKRIVKQPVARRSSQRLKNYKTTSPSPAQIAQKALQEQKNEYGCKKYEQELYEVKNAYSKVRKELNEVNLLNSKLLYVNRIFKSNSLDDSQKLRVVETLDKAGSVKEAKLIYETIKDSFNISKDTKKVRTPRKNIKEGLGMASKASGISRTKRTAPKRAVINESDNMISRFQKLANIKIKE